MVRDQWHLYLNCKHVYVHNSLTFEALLTNYATELIIKKLYSLLELPHSLAVIFAGLVRKGTKILHQG